MKPKVAGFEEEQALFRAGVEALQASRKSLLEHFGLSLACWYGMQGKAQSHRVRPGPERLYELARLCRDRAQALVNIAVLLEKECEGRVLKGQFGGRLSPRFPALEEEEEETPTAEAAGVSGGADNAPSPPASRLESNVA